jgi:uncharacterized membrane protein
LLERLFGFAFKYRPVIFSQGDLAFSPPWPATLGLVAALVAAAVAVWAYRRRTTHEAPRPARLALLGLRLAAIAVVFVCLLRPVLVVRAIEPQRNFLAILVDDSRSMTIADDRATPRTAFIRDAFGESGALRQALARRFTLRSFRFSATTERTASPDGGTWAGTRSNIGQALVRTAEELAGLPVSGIVLLTDGADTSGAGLAETLRTLRAAGMPVFAVGLGRESLSRDVQLGRVDPPVSVLKGSTLVVDVVISQTGFAGRVVPLVVEDEGQQLTSQDVTLPPDNEPATVRVRFTLADKGPRVLHFRIPVLDGEQVTQNNQRDALVTVEDRRDRILYIEGQTRPEMKFLRQAVADDKNLQVVTLQRTAERKFLRLDIDAPDDLVGGFPKTREELYAYRGIILGSIEAGAFAPDQLQMMADFVSLRGGGLLALGGRLAFAEGGYAGTPVAEALPVEVETTKAADSYLATLKVHPTRLGLTHVATQVGGTEEASAQRWTSLPALTGVNPIRRAKPGAAVLLTARDGDRGEQVVLAHQRYGAGKAIAFPVQDSWQWQMHADITLEDQTHETFWRRLLRWLVDGVSERLEVAVDHERVERGDPVVVTAKVRDERFIGVNNAALRATLTGPDGRATDVPLSFVVDREGEYRGTFTAGDDGLYEVDVTAGPASVAATGKGGTGSQPAAAGKGGAGVQPADKSTLQARAFVRSAPDDREYFDAAMRSPFLRRVAEDTGGRFYTPGTASTLPEDITYLGRGITVTQEKDLWDMPAVLVLLVGLVGGEWLLRRRWGLA